MAAVGKHVCILVGSCTCTQVYNFTDSLAD